MQCRGVKISTVRPDQCVSVAVNRHLIEKVKVEERAIHLAAKDRKKIDSLLRAVIKSNTNRIRPDDLQSPDLANQMLHTFYFSGSIRTGFLPAWSRSQSASNSD